MLLREAKEILKKNGYRLVEDSMYDRAMGRVKKANDRSKRNDAYDVMRPYKHSEKWEEGGHAEWNASDMDYVEFDDAQEFREEVVEALKKYYLPIYMKKGFTKEEYAKENGNSNNWDWSLKEILEKVFMSAVLNDKQFEKQERWLSVEEACEYLKPFAGKVLAKCWRTYKNGESWFDPYKFSVHD